MMGCTPMSVFSACSKLLGTLEALMVAGGVAMLKTDSGSGCALASCS